MFDCASIIPTVLGVLVGTQLDYTFSKRHRHCVNCSVLTWPVWNIWLLYQWLTIIYCSPPHKNDGGDCDNLRTLDSKPTRPSTWRMMPTLSSIVLALAWLCWGNLSYHLLPCPSLHEATMDHGIFTRNIIRPLPPPGSCITTSKLTPLKIVDGSIKDQSHQRLMSPGAWILNTASLPNSTRWACT